MSIHEKPMLERFYEFLGRPLTPAARLLLVLSVIPLVASFFFPLWRIDLHAPQYPDGLWLEIYSYTIKGGDEGQHLQEINTLNHYIGMAAIDRAALSDLDWLPFALGAITLLTLRVAAIGNVRALIDVLVLTLYAGGFGMARFAYKLWFFGHNLDPRAPVTVDPFMPPLLGSKQIANFTSTSLPQLGTFMVGIFVATVGAVLLWQLFIGRKNALRELAAHRDPGVPGNEAGSHVG